MLLYSKWIKNLKMLSSSKSFAWLSALDLTVEEREWENDSNTKRQKELDGLSVGEKAIPSWNFFILYKEAGLLHSAEHTVRIIEYR